MQAAKMKEDLVSVLLAESVDVRCGMYIVHVQVRVQPDKGEAFKAASRENSRQSLLEAGVVRFDVCENLEDPSEFVLVEIYRTEADAALHKQTAHYAAWRDAVESMMAEPRRSKKYKNVCPTDEHFA